MNSNALLLAIAASLACLLSACQAPLISDDGLPDNGAQWDTLDFRSERPLLALHATQHELYTISENAFVRFNGDLEVIDMRPFTDISTGTSVPALSDNAFVRLTINEQNRPVVEFHLARNAAQVVEVLVDSLPAPVGNSLEIETKANAIGTFKSDGTQFLLAAKVLPARYYSLFLFNLQFNAQHNQLVSVEMAKRIDLPDLPAVADGVVRALRFINGNYYVATEEGAWRVTPSGNAARIFHQWKLDCFTWQGDLYMPGFDNFNLDKSIDNGLSWERVNLNSELRQVTVVDTTILTQATNGLEFKLMPKSFTKAKSIAYPPSVTDLDRQSAIFYGAAFFVGKYFFSLDREIFYTTEIVEE